MGRLVAGVDSSTQATKIVVCDADTGEVLRTGRAEHPDGTEVGADRWWEAFRTAGTRILDGVEAISIAGQQHGLVTVDADGELVRPTLLWNDTRSGDAADELVSELGAAYWVDAVGVVPVPSFTITKLRWMARNEPELTQRVDRVMLPHDWLTWRLLGKPERAYTDRGDASGTGYFSPASNVYRPDLLKRAFGRTPELPEVLGASDVAGYTTEGVLVAAGTGDNMAAALGLELVQGDVVVSLGTSGRYSR